MSEEEHGLVHRLHDGDGISSLVLDAVAPGRIRVPAAAPCNRVQREPLPQDRFDELPVRVVIAERAVHEHEWRAAAGLLVRDDHASW
jgi:hypothetical protein